MTTQPEALRLAAILEDEKMHSMAIDTEAAAELRRLHAVCEALRTDAERYRWLRDNRTNYGLTQEDGYGSRELKGWEELDAAIDAARSKT